MHQQFKGNILKVSSQFSPSLLSRALYILSKLRKRADPLIELVSRRKVAFPKVSAMQNRRNLFEEVSEAEAETRNEKFDFSRKS